MAKIGSPLFILREHCAKDLMAVLDRLSALGFDGVEFVGFFGCSPNDIKKRLDTNGLQAVGDHVSFNELSQQTDAVIEARHGLGCKYITVGSPPPDGLPGGENYRQSLETLCKIGEAVKAAGMRLLFHNHANELRQQLDGKTLLEHLMDDMPSALLAMEPDLGWMQIGGADPAYFLQKYKDRCPVIHFKDFMPTQATNDEVSAEKPKRNFVFRPTGYGVVPNAQLYALSIACAPEWYIMDHDCAYERDIYQDLSISLQYFKNLVALGL